MTDDIAAPEGSPEAVVPSGSARPPHGEDPVGRAGGDQGPPPEIVEAIHRLGGDQSAEVLMSVFQAAAWSGPLPPPELLAAYKTAGEDIPDRVVRMAEQQAEHRRQLEGELLKGDNRRADRGQHYAFVIAMTVIVGGIVLLAMDKPVTGLVTLLTGLGGLVGLFIYGRHREDRQRAERRGEVAPQPTRRNPE